jgi:hypothetical protein
VTGPRPLHGAAEAVAHALAMRGRGVYQLGAGDLGSNNDDPRDCFGFAVCECYGLRRHRPGFNRGWRDPDGSGPTVVDDLNCNSAIEDARHAGELFAELERPELGALIAYPTIRLPGHEQPWIGHVKIVVGLSRCLEWDAARPDWSVLDTVECRGPNGRKPGIVAGNGRGMLEHDAKWPKREHRTAMLRVRA